MNNSQHLEPRPIAEKIAVVIDNTEEVAKRSINLRKNAELLSWEKIAARLHEIYTEEFKQKPTDST